MFGRQSRRTQGTTKSSTKSQAKSKSKLPKTTLRSRSKVQIHTKPLSIDPLLPQSFDGPSNTQTNTVSSITPVHNTFRSTTTSRAHHHSNHNQSTIVGDKFADTWTRQAKALGYPSRAVFKLIQAQKKFKVLQPGDVVVDLGCSPGSWSKLSSTVVGGSGFVLGMDLTTLSPQEQSSIGVRPGDVNRRFQYPKSYDDGSSAGGLLASERKLLKSRAPVAYMQQDVTNWKPGPGFEHQVDVILSDMAPNTTGIASADSSNSIDLCYSVVELCSQLFKPPSTKVEQLSGPAERQRALQKLKSDPNHENVLVDHLTQQFNKNMEKRYGGSSSSTSNDTTQVELDESGYIVNPPDNHTPDQINGTERASGFVSSTTDAQGKSILQHSNQRINLKMIKKTLKQHVYLQKPNAMGICETDEASAIYKTNERTLSQIRGDEHISTTWRGTLMMKVFQGEGITDLMNILKQIFVSTYTFKPESSRSESVEIFIICKGYCGPFDHTRITNKHIRRPKTEEYLRSYVSNNRKRPQAPHDPTKSLRYHVGFTPDSPMSQPVMYAESALANKANPKRKLSLAQLYEQASGGAEVSFTADGFRDQEREQRDVEAHVDQIQRIIASGVTTNVHSAIKNTASLEQGAMSPLQREISESDDMIVFHREQFDQLYNRDRVVNQIPDTDALIKSMSLFWDEGINFAKKMSIESQSPARVDVFHPKTTFTEQINQDELTSILDDSSAPPPSSVTAASIIQEHKRLKRKSTRGTGTQDEENPILANLLKKPKSTKLVPAKATSSDEIPSADSGDEIKPEAPKTKSIRAKKTTAKTAVDVADKNDAAPKRRGRPAKAAVATVATLVNTILTEKKSRKTKTVATAVVGAAGAVEQTEPAAVVPKRKTSQPKLPTTTESTPAKKRITRSTEASIQETAVAEPVAQKKTRATKSKVEAEPEPIMTKTKKTRITQAVIAQEPVAAESITPKKTRTTKSKAIQDPVMPELKKTRASKTKIEEPGGEPTPEPLPKKTRASKTKPVEPVAKPVSIPVPIPDTVPDTVPVAVKKRATRSTKAQVEEPVVVEPVPKRKGRPSKAETPLIEAPVVKQPIKRASKKVITSDVILQLPTQISEEVNDAVTSKKRGRKPAATKM